MILKRYGTNIKFLCAIWVLFSIRVTDKTPQIRLIFLWLAWAPKELAQATKGVVASLTAVVLVLYPELGPRGCTQGWPPVSCQSRLEDSHVWGLTAPCGCLHVVHY